MWLSWHACQHAKFQNGRWEEFRVSNSTNLTVPNPMVISVFTSEVIYVCLLMHWDHTACLTCPCTNFFINHGILSLEVSFPTILAMQSSNLTLVLTSSARGHVTSRSKWSPINFFNMGIKSTQFEAAESNFDVDFAIRSPSHVTSRPKWSLIIFSIWVSNPHNLRQLSSILRSILQSDLQVMWPQGPNGHLSFFSIWVLNPYNLRLLSPNLRSILRCELQNCKIHENRIF